MSREEKPQVTYIAVSWCPISLNLLVVWYELKQNLQATKKYVTKLVHSSSHPSLRRNVRNAPCGMGEVPVWQSSRER